MGDTFSRVLGLVTDGKFRVSLHAVKELSDDGLLIEPLIDNLADATVVEDYPEYHKGPSVLVLQRDEFGGPVHLVWGIPAGAIEPAVLITAYRPTSGRWDATFTRRRK